MQRAQTGVQDVPAQGRLSPRVSRGNGDSDIQIQIFTESEIENEIDTAGEGEVEVVIEIKIGSRFEIDTIIDIEIQD